MTTPPPRAVIFDLDGVIVDSSHEHYESFAALGAEVGYRMTREEFPHYFGRRNEEIFPMLLGAISPERVAELAERKESIFRDLIRERVTPLPGVRALVGALRDAGFRLAIGSSTPRANIDLILEKLEFRPYFAAIVGAEDVTAGKPDPQVFVTAAQRLGVDPARSVVVEDAVAGVQAAKRGGMYALGVTTNHSRASLHEADRVVDSLAEVGPEDFAALLDRES